MKKPWKGRYGIEMEQFSLFGWTSLDDKVRRAIERLKAFEPPEGYYLAFSGGKDSQCVYHLALEAEEIKQLQQEIEQLKDENASLRNWNACEEKLHNELLESDKRRWELESELEDANNYRAGLEAIVDKLRAQVARMRDALEQFKYDYEQNYPMYQSYLAVCQLLREDTVQAYHNPTDVEALRKAREAIKAAWSDGSVNAAMNKASEALTAIDKAIGGKEDA